MSIILFANNAGSTLAGGITNVATTANLASGTGVLFPSPTAGQYFVGTFTDALTGELNEIVHVTNVTGDVITMVRAQEGTTALNWLANDLFNNNWTAGQATSIESQQAQPLGFYNLSGSATGGTATASWTADQVIAGQTLSGTTFLGTSLTLSFNGAGTGANGMDTGSIPSGGDLSVYAIYNPGSNTWATLGCAGGTSNTTIYGGANMPSGYVGSVLIWTGKTGSSLINQFYQFNKDIFIVGNTFASGLTASSYTSQSCSLVAPANAKTITGNFNSSGALGQAYIAGNADGVGEQVCQPYTTQNYLGVFVNIPIITSQTIYYKVVNGGTLILLASGYSF